MSKLSYYVFIILCFLTNQFLTSQNNILVEGKVVDQNDFEIPFAAV